MLLLLSAPLSGAKAMTDNGKMSPYVQRVALKSQMVGTRKKPSLAGTLCAFVQLENAGGERTLADEGCRILDRRGDIVIATIPVNRLRRVASAAGVARIEANAPCRLAMDTVSAVVNALPVYRGESLPQAFTGRGVVVGVMDVGFDLTHPNFYDASATQYRIKAFWDQLSADTVGSALPVGRDYTAESDILGVRHSADGLFQTHGTHTLGIAAGSGYDTAYRGMAYESDICIVGNAVTEDTVLISPADLYKYTTATDALGFKYIFDYAEKRGLPCVASFSEGYYLQDDADDRLFCEYLNRLTGPGRIIVAAAGNEGGRLTYLPKPSGVDEAGSFIYSVARSVPLSVKADGDFTMRLIAYEEGRTDTLSVRSEDCLPDTVTRFPFVSPDGEAWLTVSVDRYPSAFDSLKTVYRVTLEGSRPLHKLPRMAFTLGGIRADVEARLLSGIFQNGRMEARWSGAEATHNVLAPGCFPGIITVGSTIHRTGFTNYEGHYYDYSQTGRNDGVRSAFSSVGPAVDGSFKPDVMAPGSNVVSSYSSFYLEHHPQASDIQSDVAHFSFGGRTYAWNSNTGTSMAAPVVAGALALWLQARPDLTPAEVMQALSRTSRQPEEGLSYPNNLYGYGEIDVYRGLLDVLQLSGIRDLSDTPAADVKMSVTAGRLLRLSFARRPSASLRLTVYDMGGAVVCRRTVEPADGGSQDVGLPVLPAGVYVMQLSSGEPGFTGSALVRMP